MQKNVMMTAVLSLFLAACGGESKPAASADTDNANAQPEANAQGGSGGYLNIYNWSDYVDPQTVADFGKARNITIRYDYYDSNEALEGKVLTGKSGYDIVAPTIGFVGRQIQAGAYQKLDKSKIPNYNLISPVLLEKMAVADPGNQYAVPFFWGMNTVGINVDKVKAALGDLPMPENEWDLVFNPDYAQKLQSCGISILDSQYEVLPIALNHLGKDPQSNNKDDLKAAVDLIGKVRPYIKRFSSSGYIDDMARGDLCLTLGYGGDIHIAQRRAEEAKNGVKLKVFAPKAGVGLWVDSFMLPVDAKNLDNAYAYINDALDPKVAAKNGDFVSYAPSSLPAKDLMKPEFVNEPSIFPTDDVLKNSFMLLQKDPETVKYSVRLWQQLKSGK
ncbi:MAG: polyamine ABC transporter substrate-binding protein [Neisseriaceae bacterium]|nr:polyamine ABC transporter substrate-binding protein [Neisseriaceae bacterium]MBP6863152.1 polyamine ABC transporter substrate-binding protein [Neisseriaceae bacterium]